MQRCDWMKLNELDSMKMNKLRSLFDSQPIAVLGTSSDDPYSCLVGFKITDDFKYLIFATMRDRLKYRQITTNPRVSLMIDDRSDQKHDFKKTTSVTIIGTAEDIKGKHRQDYAELLLEKHPVLEEFINDNDCAVMRVSIDRMYVVSNFESVLKIEF
jgi:nitroimidazol reductase NimA-like FMN-containing flavoprotein (pyridoxamine 5'-phosphate oxidase superfamily)